MERFTAQGRLVYAAAIAALGVEHFVCARAGGAAVPVIPWVPAIPVLAYGTGAGLLAAGVCVAAKFKPRLAAALLGIFFLVCVAAIQIPQVVAQPMDIGVRTGAFETLSMAAAALTLASTFLLARRSVRPWEQALDRLFLDRLFPCGRYLFAASCVVFGFDHFPILRFIASLIPPWFPGGMFWAVFTGAAMLAAGICIAARWMDYWAAALLGIMFLIWFLFLHIPRLINPARFHNPDEWSSAFIALAMCGASWIVAQDSLRGHQPVAVEAGGARANAAVSTNQLQRRLANPGSPRPGLFHIDRR